MTPELQQQIEQQAREYAIHHSSAPDKETPDWIIQDFIAGATAYAERAEELERENAQLKRWKEEAKPLLNKILDWAQEQKDIKLGKSVFDEAVERLGEHKELKERNNKMRETLEIIHDIKDFTDKGGFVHQPFNGKEKNK